MQSLGVVERYAERFFRTINGISCLIMCLTSGNDGSGCVTIFYLALGI